MTSYACRDCGHVYGTTVPAPALIVLHRTVSHTPGALTLTNTPR